MKTLEQRVARAMSVIDSSFAPSEWSELGVTFEDLVWEDGQAASILERALAEGHLPSWWMSSGRVLFQGPDRYPGCHSNCSRMYHHLECRRFGVMTHHFPRTTATASQPNDELLLALLLFPDIAAAVERSVPPEHKLVFATHVSDGYARVYRGVAEMLVIETPEPKPHSIVNFSLRQLAGFVDHEVATRRTTGEAA